jgi:hypothetical protein
MGHPLQSGGEVLVANRLSCSGANSQLTRTSRLTWGAKLVALKKVVHVRVAGL